MQKNGQITPATPPLETDNPPETQAKQAKVYNPEERSDSPIQRAVKHGEHKERS